MPRAAPMLALLCSVLTWQTYASAEDLTSQAQRAKQAMLAHRYPEAAALYRHMSAELPGDPAVQFNLALALHSLGSYQESTKILESIRTAGKSNAKYWFLLGEGYLRLDQPTNAVAALQQADELDQSNLDTSLELASAWLEDRQYSEAFQRFQTLAVQHPELPRVWAGLSLSQSGLGEARAAAQSRERLAALPESVEQHELLARIFRLKGEQAEVVRELRAAASLEPGNIGVQSSLARALLASREFDAAVKILRGLLAKDTKNPAWQFDLGDALLNTGHTEEALPHLAAAVALSPTLLAAQAKLGEALLLTGATSQAVTHLELAAPIDQDGSIHMQLATAYRRLGKQDLASKAMARRLEIQDRSH